MQTGLPFPRRASKAQLCGAGISAWAQTLRQRQWLCLIAVRPTEAKALRACSTVAVISSTGLTETVCTLTHLLLRWPRPECLKILRSLTSKSPARVTSLRPEVKARSKTCTCSIRKFQQVANTTEPLPISKTVALCVTYLLTQVKQLSSEAGQRSEFWRPARQAGLAECSAFVRAKITTPSKLSAIEATTMRLLHTLQTLMNLKPMKRRKRSWQAGITTASGSLTTAYLHLKNMS